MLIRTIKSIKPGQNLITVSDAIKLDSGILSDPKENKATAVAEIKQYIEGQSIKAYGTDAKGDVYYDASDLKIPSDNLI